VGINADLTTLLPELAPAEIGWALGLYTTSAKYLLACLEGAQRVDLFGAPAGIVTADQAEHARQFLANLRARGHRPPTPPAPPKRITLSGLREAGRQRREGGTS
jgi:ProP effector